jgi:hypothetical protein
MKLLVIINADSLVTGKLLIKSFALDKYWTGMSVTEQRSNRFKTVIWIKIGEHLSDASAIYSGLKQGDAFPPCCLIFLHNMASVVSKRKGWNLSVT